MDGLTSLQTQLQTKKTSTSPPAASLLRLAKFTFERKGPCFCRDFKVSCQHRNLKLVHIETESFVVAELTPAINAERLSSKFKQVSLESNLNL